jgi:hypothetical protein
LGGPECRDACDEVRESCVAPSETPCTPDANPCTSDFCNSTGQCIHPLNSGSCDDGIFCNGTDVCSGGSCSLHLGNPCQALLDECRDTCDEQGRACQTPAGSPCADDHNVCTLDQCDGTGECVHTEHASFVAQRLSVTRIGGASNDRLIMKGTFSLADLTSSPSDTGFKLDVVGTNGAVIYTSTVPAAAIEASATVFRFSDRTGAYPQANGVTSALIKSDARKGLVRLTLRMRDYDVPGVVGAASVAVALSFGQTGGGDDCVTDVVAPCAPRGSKVICGD